MSIPHNNARKRHCELSPSKLTAIPESTRIYKSTQYNGKQALVAYIQTFSVITITLRKQAQYVMQFGSQSFRGNIENQHTFFVVHSRTL